jgi:hypothetical protein
MGANVNNSSLANIMQVANAGLDTRAVNIYRTLDAQSFEAREVMVRAVTILDSHTLLIKYAIANNQVRPLVFETVCHQ